MSALQPRDAWEIYTSAWSEADPAKRLERLAQAVVPKCTYADPHTQCVGHDELSQCMLRFQKSVPGGRFMTQEFMHHHDFSLAHWHLIDGRGQTSARGISFGAYDADGRLKQMTGFFS